MNELLSNTIQELKNSPALPYITLALLVFGIYIIYKFFKTLYNNIVVDVRPTKIKVLSRFGQIHRSLPEGFHFKIPIIDSIVAESDILEHGAEIPEQDVITSDNAILKVKLVLFYRVVDASKALYRTPLEQLDAALIKIAVGIIRSELARFEFDQMQTSRQLLYTAVSTAMKRDMDDWGVEITRVEILSVDVDEETRKAMLKQLNAERNRRAAVTEAAGAKEIADLKADAAYYEAQKIAEAELLRSKSVSDARRLEAESEAYATEIMAKAIKENGLEAAQYHVALKQVEVLSKVGDGEGKQMVILPSDFVDSFGNVFKMLKGGK